MSIVTKSNATDGWATWVRPNVNWGWIGTRRTAATEHSASSPITIIPLTEHHIVYTYNGTTHIMYIDGMLLQNSTSNISLIANGVPLLIGHSSGQ